MKTRYITSSIRESFSHFPVVLINGARQVGKSTLVQQLLAEGIVERYITLDDITVLTAAVENPQGFLKQFSGPVAIDEVQRCPDLLLAIKHQVDQHKKPGQFLLTGSANVLSYPKVCESLAGRMDLFSLEGLSVCEANELPPSPFLTDLFSDRPLQELAQTWRPNRSFNILKSVFMGGFPEVMIKEDEYFKNRWMNAYFNSYVQRDVRDLAKNLDIVHFSKVVQILSVQTGQLLNINNVSVDVGLDQRTLTRYMKILALTFQAYLLQPYSANINKRLIKTPKIFAADSGFAAFLMNIEGEAQMAKSPQVGHLVETWVYGELRKYAALLLGVQIYFYRTHQGKEVDFVLKKGDKVVGIECKLAAHVKVAQLPGLLELVDSVSNARGIVLYSGDEILALHEKILAVPFGIFS